SISCVMVYGIIIHSFLSNPQLLNYLNLLQQQSRLSIQPLIRNDPNFVESEEFDNTQFEDDPQSLEIYLSYFYENIHQDCEETEKMTKAIALKVSKHHRYQMQNILANSDVETLLQNKSGHPTKFISDDLNDKKCVIYM